MALSSRQGMDQAREILLKRREGNVETIVPDGELFKRYTAKHRLYEARLESMR